MIQLDNDISSNILRKIYFVENLLFRRFWLSQFNRIERFLGHQAGRVDRQTQRECIDYLQCQYPRLSVVQASQLLDHAFQGEFTRILFDYFSPSDWKYKYLRLLDCLKSGAIQYLFENGVWQMYLPQTSSHRGIRYLITYGPSEELQTQLWQHHGLMFYCGPSIYGRQAQVWEQYPFSSGLDVSCGDPRIEALRPIQ